MKKRKIGRPKGSKNKLKIKQYGRSVASALNDEMSKALDDAVARGFGKEPKIYPIKTVTIQYGDWTLSGTGPVQELQEFINQMKGVI